MLCHRALSLFPIFARSRKNMRIYLVVCFCFVCVLNGYGQQEAALKPDTILFENGKVLATHVIDTSGEKIVIEKPNLSKHKQIEVDRDNVFSIRYGNSGKEVVIYIYDTLTGNDFTVAEARMFIAGEQDAQKGYHAMGTSIGAFAIGVASGLTGASFFVLGPPFLYSGLMSYPRIHIRHKSVTNLNDVKSDSYLYGYDNTARRKRVFRSMIWGGIGLITGIAAHFVLYQK